MSPFSRKKVYGGEYNGFKGRPVTADRQLFRQEAIDFQRHNRQWGSVAALQPFSTKVFSWFLVTIVALIAAFLVRGEYARKETVVGYLTPMSGTSKVFSNSRRPVKASVYRGFPLVLS
jgi:hypothetical protein